MQGGLDVMGQRLIFMAGQFICLLLALLPAVVLAVVLVLAVFIGEILLGVHWFGSRFERLDISAELRP